MIYHTFCLLILEEVIEISDDKDDDLAKAIELSLREAHVSTKYYQFFLLFIFMFSSTLVEILKEFSKDNLRIYTISRLRFLEYF